MRNYEKFFTPEPIADVMADILNPMPSDVILEPHAGNGSLCRAIKRKCINAFIIAVENDSKWADSLSNKNTCDIYLQKDFLHFDSIPRFTSCIANPPFGNGINLLAHFNQIIRHVKTGGKIVMIVPETFTPDIPHETIPINNWSANSDGTTTAIKIIHFNNPQQHEQ